METLYTVEMVDAKTGRVAVSDRNLGERDVDAVYDLYAAQAAEYPDCYYARIIEQ